MPYWLLPVLLIPCALNIFNNPPNSILVYFLLIQIHFDNTKDNESLMKYSISVGMQYYFVHVTPCCSQYSPCSLNLILFNVLMHVFLHNRCYLGVFQLHGNFIIAHHYLKLINFMVRNVKQNVHYSSFEYLYLYLFLVIDKIFKKRKRLFHSFPADHLHTLSLTIWLLYASSSSK